MPQVLTLLDHLTNQTDNFAEYYYTVNVKIINNEALLSASVNVFGAASVSKLTD